MNYPRWQYDEMQQVGTDYTDDKQVKAYDLHMQKLRDVKKETEDIIKIINLKSDHSVLEIGTGTGSFAIEAARHCKKIIALDISPNMLGFAGNKARALGVSNIEFHNAGFLTYVHRGEPFDAIVSQLALHHLPDFWKMVAIRRIFGMLKSGGKFYLKDSVYSFEIENYEKFFDNLLKMMKDTAGEELAHDCEISIREEYLTLGWIMEGMLKRAGFDIDSAEYLEGFIGIYVCTKRK